MQPDESTPSEIVGKLRDRVPRTDSKDTETVKPPGSLWTFVNSSFGIFLLSSVVLGLFSFSYSSWRDYQTRSRLIEQLDMEIGLRVSAIDKMAKSKDNIRYSNLANITDVIDGSDKVPFYVRKPILNEFENKTLTSVMWQLYSFVPDSHRKEVGDAIRQTNEILDRLRQTRYTVVDEPKQKTKVAQDQDDDKLKKDYGRVELYKEIEALGKISRWKKLGLGD